MKGYLLNIRVPAPLFSALSAHVETKRFAEFARVSLAEKLARDFGEKIDVDSLKMRVGQGRRTDLIERSRAAREAARAALEREEASFSSAKTEEELFAKIGRAMAAATAENGMIVEEARIRARREPKIRAALKAWEAERARKPFNLSELEKAWIVLCAALNAD